MKFWTNRLHVGDVRCRVASCRSLCRSLSLALSLARVNG